MKHEILENIKLAGDVKKFNKEQLERLCAELRDEIIEKVSELKDKESVIFIPESLEYLKRGGRISPAVATIANLIGVLPILTFKDGVCLI